MPRFVSVKAARNARRASASELRAPRAVSLSEALDLREEENAIRWDGIWDARRAEKRAVAGRANLIEREIPALEAAVEKRLPDYLRTGSGRPLYAPADVETAARMGGWIRSVAAGEYPAVLRVVKATQNRGAFGGLGKYTSVSLMEIIRRWPSPGRLEDAIRKVKFHANAILAAYAGKPRVAWWALGVALAANRRHGQAAVIAAALTLGALRRDDKVTYRAARAALVDLHLEKPVVRKVDDHLVRHGHQPVLVEGDLAVYAANFSGEGCISLSRSGWLVRVGNHQHLVQHGRYYTEGSDYCRTSPEEACAEVREALAQAKAEAESKKRLAAFLTGTEKGYCPLIQISFLNFQQSQEILWEHGVSGVYVPGPVLVDLLDFDIIRWEIEQIMEAA